MKKENVLQQGIILGCVEEMKYLRKILKRDGKEWPESRNWSRIKAERSGFRRMNDVMKNNIPLSYREDLTSAYCYSL